MTTYIIAVQVYVIYFKYFKVTFKGNPFWQMWGFFVTKIKIELDPQLQLYQHQHHCRKAHGSISL